MRSTVIGVILTATTLLCACRPEEEFIFTPVENPKFVISGRYPTGTIPPSGLIGPGDQRAIRPWNAARGLELREDWATTGHVSRSTEHGPAPTLPFGAQGSEHNGGSDADHRPLPAAPPGALTVTPPNKMRDDDGRTDNNSHRQVDPNPPRRP